MDVLGEYSHAYSATQEAADPSGSRGEADDCRGLHFFRVFDDADKDLVGLSLKELGEADGKLAA